MITVAGIGLAQGGTSAAAPPATVSAPATAAAPTTTVAAERPDRFLALFVKALRDGDRGFLFDRFLQHRCRRQGHLHRHP